MGAGRGPGSGRYTAGRTVTITYREAVRAALREALAERPARLPHGRGRRAVRRRLRRQHGPARRVRPRARARHAALRVGVRRRRHRRGARRHAADRRGDDDQLQPARARPGREQRGHAPLHVGRTAAASRSSCGWRPAAAGSSPPSTRTASRSGTRTCPASRRVAPATVADARGMVLAALEDAGSGLHLRARDALPARGRASTDGDLPLDGSGGAASRERRHARHLRRLALEDASTRPRRSPRDGIEAEVIDLRSLRPLDIEHRARLGREDAPGRDRRRGLADRQPRRRDRRADRGARLRPARLAAAAGLQRRGADAVREAPRGRRAPERRAHRRRRDAEMLV